MIYCRNCNNSLDVGDLFCTKCGLKVKDEKLCGNDTKVSKKYEDLISCAAEGDPDAMYALGNLLFYGKNVSRSLEKAVILFEKAANKGSAKAQNKLGSCYIIGEGVEQNLELGLFWIEKASKQGYASAQFNLGNLYFNGLSVEQDFTKAFELFLQAAEQDNDLAEYMIGEYYYYGYLGVKDIKKAFGYYVSSANKGNLDAKFKVGRFFFSGEVVEQDIRKGLAIIKECSEKGNREATSFLKKQSDFLLQGNYTSCDRKFNLDSLEREYKRFVDNKEYFNAYMLLNDMPAKARTDIGFIPNYWQILSLAFVEDYKKNGFEEAIKKYVTVSLKKCTHQDLDLLVTYISRKTAYLIAAGYWCSVYQYQAFERICQMRNLESYKDDNNVCIEKNLVVLDVDAIRIDMYSVVKDFAKWIVVLNNVVVKNLKKANSNLDFRKFEYTYEQEEMLKNRVMSKLQNNWGLFNLKLTQLSSERNCLNTLLTEFKKLNEPTKKRDLFEIGGATIINPMYGALTIGNKIKMGCNKSSKLSETVDAINEHHKKYIEKSIELFKDVDGFIVELYEELDKIGQTSIKNSLFKVIRYTNENGNVIGDLTALFK